MLACDATKPTASIYSTTFAADENPISEGGIWKNGLADGLDWSDAKTLSGNAVGSRRMEDAQSRYSDDIAILKNTTYPADQYAQATVYRAGGYVSNGGNHELELLLRFSISAHDAHGYELLWGTDTAGLGYVSYVRWNGAQSSYTVVWESSHGAVAIPAAGDVWRAEINGNDLSAYINGSLVHTADVSAIGTVYTTGQPGIGFWPVDGAIAANLGWKDFEAGQFVATAAIAPSLPGTATLTVPLNARLVLLVSLAAMATLAHGAGLVLAIASTLPSTAVLDWRALKGRTRYLSIPDAAIVDAR